MTPAPTTIRPASGAGSMRKAAAIVRPLRWAAPTLLTLGGRGARPARLVNWKAASQARQKGASVMSDLIARGPVSPGKREGDQAAAGAVVLDETDAIVHHGVSGA